MLFVFFYEYEYVTEVDFVCRNQTLLNENHYKNDRKSNVVYVAMLRILHTIQHQQVFNRLSATLTRACSEHNSLSLSLMLYAQPAARYATLRCSALASTTEPSVANQLSIALASVRTHRIV